MSKKSLPKTLLAQCAKVAGKRPRTVIDHILKHGFVTTEELSKLYGYNHPPRAARDVREQGIPLEMFRVEGSDGRKIAAYRFGKPCSTRFARTRGRTAFSRELKEELIKGDGAQCAIYLEKFPERELQIDHRVPFEVAGNAKARLTSQDFMLLSGSANRAKSWSCEHCINWRETRNPEICRNCYWAYPDNYTHVAMRPARRLDILWIGKEVEIHDGIKRRADKLQKSMPAHVKEILEKHVLKQ